MDDHGRQKAERAEPYRCEKWHRAVDSDFRQLVNRQCAQVPDETENRREEQQRVDTRESFRRSGAFVGKILNGAKPADLPIERPEKFELVVNLKAAKALGLTIPQSLLLRADPVR